MLGESYLMLVAAIESLGRTESTIDSDDTKGLSFSSYYERILLSPWSLERSSRYYGKEVSGIQMFPTIRVKEVCFFCSKLVRFITIIRYISLSLF